MWGSGRGFWKILNIWKGSQDWGVRWVFNLRKIWGWFLIFRLLFTLYWYYWGCFNFNFRGIKLFNFRGIKIFNFRGIKIGGLVNFRGLGWGSINDINVISVHMDSVLVIVHAWWFRIRFLEIVFIHT